MTTTTTDLVAQGTSIETAPTLEGALVLVAALVDAHDSDALDEARIRSEALALYAKRQANRELERHYAEIRLTVEAGLGVLTYAKPDLAPNLNVRSTWRALAAAFERRRLPEVLRARTEIPTSTSAAFEARRRGFTYANGIPWWRARAGFIAEGVDLATVPPDPEKIRQVERNIADNSKRALRSYDRAARYARMKASREIGAAAKETGPKLGNAYGHLRRTLQALHDAQFEFERGESRRHIEHAISCLYRAEESIGAALGLQYGDDVYWRGT